MNPPPTSFEVFRPDELPAKDRGGGASTIPLVTAAKGATTYLNGFTVFEPGAQIAHHTHNVAESVVIVQGEAVVDIDGVRRHLRTLDTTFVAANVPHHFENASESEPMRIFWTYGSVDATRTLVESGLTGRVDAESAGDMGGRPQTAFAVHEVATIEVIPGHEQEFEAAVRAAVPLFQAAHGARTLRLESSAEHPTTYRLVVGWDSIDDHLVGFRDSPAFTEWRALIADHVERVSQVEHLRNVLTGF